VLSGPPLGDVPQLSAGVALHSLSLAVARKVVGSTALVAGGRTTAAESAPEAAPTGESTTGSASTTSHASARVRAVTCQMAGKATGVASSAGTGTAQAQRWAVGLDVTKALAVVALLGLGGAWVRAPIRLVAGLLACGWIRDRSHRAARRRLTVVAESLGR
jgi:Flp pilus assembly protein TadB